MCAKMLSIEEIARLKSYPYVVDATERFVYFTAEFKERFYKEYQNGRKPKRILTDMGLDTNLLGKCRINSIKLHVLQQAQGKGGFTDLESSRFRTALFGTSRLKTRSRGWSMNWPIPGKNWSL